VFLKSFFYNKREREREIEFTMKLGINYCSMGFDDMASGGKP